LDGDACVAAIPAIDELGKTNDAAGQASLDERAGVLARTKETTALP
jgi:hypothetical protein